MGLLLSILLSYVGAVEFMFIVRDIIHQVGLHHEQMKRASEAPMTLVDLQQNLRRSIKSARERLCDSDTVLAMADGIQYEQGYRVAGGGGGDDDDETTTTNRWLEQRANATVHQQQSQQFADGYNLTISKNDELPCSDNNSLYSSSLSVETVVENKRYQMASNDDSDERDETVEMNATINQTKRDGHTDGDEVPAIHFNEYPEAHHHNLDGIRRQPLQKIDEGTTGRRKGAKSNAGGYGHDMMQRRRSEDIDGETDNPWGELKPESFHNDELWKRERAMSIAENDDMQAVVGEKGYKEFFRRATTSDIHKVSSHESEGNADNETNVCVIRLHAIWLIQSFLRDKLYIYTREFIFVSFIYKHRDKLQSTYSHTHTIYI